MKRIQLIKTCTCLGMALLAMKTSAFAQTTSLWLFDEKKESYPSSVLENNSSNDYPLVLGLGGKIVPGKFGNALEISGEQQIQIPKGAPDFGLTELPVPAGSHHIPLNWKNALFGAMMTAGEKHLRNEIGFVNATDTRLNLGAFNWTVDFWLQLLPGDNTPRFIFEIGQGPILETGKVTALYFDGATGNFVLKNDPSGSLTQIKSAGVKKLMSWHHLAFVYNHDTKELSHYTDGKLTSKVTGVTITALPHGNESYLSVGRDGMWNQRLNGRIDELRFSEGRLFTGNFSLPLSNSPMYQPNYKPVVLKKGLPLLFANDTTKVYNLGSRKHVFIDGAFIESMNGLQFVVNPPVKMERVIDNIKSQFRKHLTVVEDEQGLIRIYNGSVDDYLAVFTSKDGVHFEAPDLKNGDYKGIKNIVIPSTNGGLGNPFIDVNGPAEERWKYISDYRRRGVYLYTSPDGYNWTRKKTALFPFRSGSQSCTFYDDQRQRYVSYHRSDMVASPFGSGQRTSVISEMTDLNLPVEFKPLDDDDYATIAKTTALRDPLPHFLDNGPLSPGGFGLEFPKSFDPIPEDPAPTDIYVTKASKYEWAPDTYVAFPTVYFHYEDAPNEKRRILGSEEWARGSGPLETQFSVSRDGLTWHRYPRPAYVGIGQYLGRDIKTAYIAEGMVRRGNEIWQYYFGETQYHSAYSKNDSGRGVYRLVQRLDGFVSMDSPYDKEATLTTKPFTFTGNRLELNIDTDAAGYAQVGFVNEAGNPIPGYSVDDCIYVNGDFINGQVQWMNKGKDVSSLQGKTVKLVIRMRGSKLYALQFSNQSK